MVKYKELLLVPLLVPLFTDVRVRRAGLIGMTVAIGVTVMLSALLKLGWSPLLNHLYGTGDPSVGAVVFKGQIAQSYMMAVMAFFYAVLAEAASGRRRWLFGLLAAGCASNVVLMVYGRTGYAVLAVLALYFLVSRRWRSGREVAGFLLAASLLAGSAVLFAHHFDYRVAEAIHDVQHWHPHQAATTSNGLRLEFYDNTLALIKKRPLLGYGTGGFQNAYARQVAGTTMIATHNPHDDMLLMTAQLGIIGLAALLFFSWQYWRQAAALPQAPARRMARALILSLIVSGTVNSLLINHAESLFFGWWAAWIFSEWSRLPALAGARQHAAAPSITELA